MVSHCESHCCADKAPVEEELMPDEVVNVLDQGEGSGKLQDGAEVGKLLNSETTEPCFRNLSIFIRKHKIEKQKMRERTSDAVF